MIESPMGSPATSESPSTNPARAGAHYARARAARRTLDFPSTLLRGGGGLAVLLGAAVAGFYLPALARIAALVAAGAAVKLVTDRMEDGPERAVLRPAAALTVAWLGLAWGLGLLEPFVALAFAGLAGVLGFLWWRYGALIAEAEAADDAPPVPPRELTPDERLDQLLEDAPLEGLAFEDIVAALEGHMSRTTVAERLRQRGWRIRRGRWRARPAGVEPEA